MSWRRKLLRGGAALGLALVSIFSTAGPSWATDTDLTPTASFSTAPTVTVGPDSVSVDTSAFPLHPDGCDWSAGSYTHLAFLKLTPDVSGTLDVTSTVTSAPGGFYFVAWALMTSDGCTSVVASQGGGSEFTATVTAGTTYVLAVGDSTGGDDPAGTLGLSWTNSVFSSPPPSPTPSPSATPTGSPSPSGSPAPSDSAPALVTAAQFDAFSNFTQYALACVVFLLAAFFVSQWPIRK